MYREFIELVRNLYRTKEPIALHEPVLGDIEKQYLNEAIDSGFVSSVGAFVTQFEKEIAAFVDSGFAISTVNGTAALHMALLLAGVKENDEVITQPLTFVATCNAISYCNAVPVFVDVDLDTMGLSAWALELFFKEHTAQENNSCINKQTGRLVKACVPMHTFGHPAEIDRIVELCKKHNVFVIEDAAESLGSFYKGKHTGTFGELGILSFNGNKIMTTGGGGMIITNNEMLAKKAKHLTTTAKQVHPWEFNHDEVGYNYRLPNINSALGIAQLTQLNDFIKIKREIAKRYQQFFSKFSGIKFVTEPKDSISNYWLNTILLNSKEERDDFLEKTNAQGVMTRPAWNLMNTLPGRKNRVTISDINARFLADRLVNIPSGVPTA